MYYYWLTCIVRKHTQEMIRLQINTSKTTVTINYKNDNDRAVVWSA